MKNIQLIGAAIGIGAQNPASQYGPSFFQYHHSLEKLQQKQQIHWKEIIEASTDLDRLHNITQFLHRLENSTKNSIKENYFPLVVGGDHSIAIGTWAGIVNALILQNNHPNMGLLWIDAHLDSHTFETSPSNAVHGMPLAVLLGYGGKELLEVGGNYPRFDPKHVVVLGARSWEEGEKALLDKLGVTIITMNEVNEKGLLASLQKAETIISQGTTHYGITLDLDVFDPTFAPGVCSKEDNGLNPTLFIEAIKNTNLLTSPQLAGLEIAEFAPAEDKDNKTYELLLNLVSLIE